MKRKKVIVIIVEGASDEEALGFLLQEYFSSCEVRIQIIHGDITNKTDQEGIITQPRLLKVIGDRVKKFLISERLSKSDVLKIIHLVDTDGTFVPASCVFEVANVGLTIYSPTKIETSHKADLEERNKRKSANLTMLSKTQQIMTIPYAVYYMSCNLDHVLYDKQNNSRHRKIIDAQAFAMRFGNDVESFVRIISESSFSVALPYNESWEFIKEDCRSLERHTNFGLCLTKPIAECLH